MNDHTSLIVCLVKVVKVVKSLGKVPSGFITIIFWCPSLFVIISKFHTVASFDSVFEIFFTAKSNQFDSQLPIAERIIDSKI